MGTKATKIGRKCIYYCPRLDDLFIVERVPIDEEWELKIGHDYAVRFEYSDGNVGSKCYLWPEVQHISRRDVPNSWNDAWKGFVKGYQGLFFMGYL